MKSNEYKVEYKHKLSEPNNLDNEKSVLEIKGKTTVTILREKIIGIQGKFITPRSYSIRYEHFPLFAHGIVRAKSVCPASRQAEALIEGVASNF